MKKILSILLLLFSLSLAGNVDAQTTVASDDFNRADENPLDGSGDWRLVDGTLEGFQILSNLATPTGADTPDFHYMIHTATLNNDQWSEVLCAAANAGAYCGLLLRWAAFGTETGYIVYSTDSLSTISMSKVVAGSGTALASTSDTGTIQGSTIRFEAIDDDLEFFIDDVSTLTASDSAIAGGNSGMFGYASGSADNAGFDDFATGNFDGGGAPTVPLRRIIN